MSSLQISEQDHPQEWVPFTKLEENVKKLQREQKQNLPKSNTTKPQYQVGIKN